MKRKNKWSFWEAIARLILRNRIVLILLLFAVTAFWASHWENMRFTFTEANLLPDNHPENVSYNKFLSLFGEEGSGERFVGRSCVEWFAARDAAP